MEERTEEYKELKILFDSFQKDAREEFFPTLKSARNYYQNKKSFKKLKKEGFSKLNFKYTALFLLNYDMSLELFYFIRDIEDPLTIIGDNQQGGINIIDLANMYSCPFIATQDLGKTFKNNNFSILGRFDNSDIRGCNLLIQ